MKALWFALAWVSFALGITGAFLPILPTTPFLILSAFLFSKSSPRFHAWLLNLPFAGPGIKDWQTNRVINPRAKILCACMISLSLLLLWLRAPLPAALKVPLTLVLTCVGTFVVTRKSR